MVEYVDIEKNEIVRESLAFNNQYHRRLNQCV